MASPLPASAPKAAPALATPASAAAAVKTPASVASSSVPPSAAGSGSPNKRGPAAHKHMFGVLHTGYLDKMIPGRALDKPKKRFVVLTHMGIHWFKRTEGYDLFGEERGSISVQDIAKVELVRAGSSTSELAASASPSGGAALDAFEVSCKQDVVRRIFRAASHEEAAAWVAAVKGAIKARSLYRRETLNGISFLPHGGHDAAHEAGPPLVSVVTLKRSNRSSRREEVVLAKGPDYHYGQLFDLPYHLAASSAAASPAMPGSSAALAPTPRGEAAAEVVSILLSNGDSAEVAVRLLAERPVGDTVLVKVTSLAHGQRAHLPLTIEAAGEAKDQATPEEEAAAATAAAAAGRQAALSAVLDVAAPVAFAVLVGLWTHAEHAEAEAPAAALAVAALSKDRLALLALVGLGLLRALLLGALAGGAKGKGKAAEAAAAAASAKRMVLRVSVDDYVLEGRHGAGDGAEGGVELEEELPPIPQRFINGCFGDMVEAERRWRVTLAWRAEFGTDAILEQEHPYYDLIKEALPHYYCKTGRDGNPVYIERSGQTDLAKAREAGIDWLVWHYIHSTEFVFRQLYPSEEAKTITIFDVEGLGMKAIAGEPFEFIRRASHLMQEHYPERCKVIIIANAPGWFSFIWKMIKPLVNETTQKKIRIVAAGKETFAAMAEFIDPQDIPVEYGGQLRYGDGADSCRWSSPEEVALRTHVQAVNQRCAETRAAQGIPEPARFVAPNARAHGH